MLSNLSTSMTAEENDLFRIKAFDNQLCYRLDSGSVNMSFNSVHKIILLHILFCWEPQVSFFMFSWTTSTVFLIA